MAWTQTLLEYLNHEIDKKYESVVSTLGLLFIQFSVLILYIETEG